MSRKQGSNSYSHILKYTGLFGSVQVLGILVGLVRNKLVAVLLGPGGMGLVSLFNSTVKLVCDSTNFGISMSAVRNISEQYDRHDAAGIKHSVNVIRLWSLLAAVLGTVLCVVLSPFLSRFTFSWNGHTLHFILLSPVVGFTAITAGELAILKGLRRLGNLARISIINAVAGLIICVPIYYFFGMAGIVPSLVLMALAQMLVTINRSYRLYPLHISFSRALMRDGYDMIRLGIAFVLAGMLGSGADFLIRSYLNNVAQIDVLGLYNAGFMLTMTYVGMVFSAMETDYFPRLSGVNHLGVTFRETVNRQIEVMLLLASPMLVAFMVGIPIILPLLFSDKFVPATNMIRIVTLAMYIRAIKLPVQYIPLAKGDSKSYLFLEAVYDVALVCSVIAFFNLSGLTGSGAGITIAGFVDLVVTLVYARWRYGYHLSRRVVGTAVCQVLLGVAVFVCTMVTTGLVYWLAGVLLMLVSLAFSIDILRRDTDLLTRFRRKFNRNR